MYEQFMDDFTYRDSASRQVQLFIRPACYISYIFPPTVVLRTLFIILNICYELTVLASYISMSLAAVIWECSLNQFSTSLLVSLFVHREPQQIFMSSHVSAKISLVGA